MTFLETLSAEGSDDWQVVLKLRYFTLDPLGNDAGLAQLCSFEDRNQFDDSRLHAFVLLFDIIRRELLNGIVQPV